MPTPQQNGKQTGKFTASHAGSLRQQCHRQASVAGRHAGRQAAPDTPLPEGAGVQHHKLEEGLLVQPVIMAQLHCNGLVGVDGGQVDVSDSAAVEAAQVALHHQPAAAPHSGNSLHALHHIAPSSQHEWHQGAPRGRPGGWGRGGGALHHLHLPHMCLGCGAAWRGGWGDCQVVSRKST